eukprot:TRINITY_DN10405_c0_g1_i1.p1 TRINITY_DN10405_c0_g1~~TRINITY_DN10405_c0_g1_i1.p1  ORF type:complete len:570 (+),score=121.03 TRINITY_DN10405_c0_g1_i1:20-1729(+)
MSRYLDRLVESNSVLLDTIQSLKSKVSQGIAKDSPSNSPSPMTVVEDNLSLRQSGTTTSDNDSGNDNPRSQVDSIPQDDVGSIVSKIFELVQGEKKLIKKAIKRANRDREKIESKFESCQSEIESLKRQINNDKAQFRILESKVKSKNDIMMSNQVLRMYLEQSPHSKIGRPAMDVLNDLILEQFEDMKKQRSSSKQWVVPTQMQYARDLPFPQDQWVLMFDSKGRIDNVMANAIKQKIFFGGVDKSIRKEVWKFLLNYYPWNSTEEERAAIKLQRDKEYNTLKQQWNMFLPSQLSNFTEFETRRLQIEKDVIRTDRDHPIFQSDSSPQLTWLQDILVTHCMYNWNLGYIQGMNKYLAQIIQVMENEEDSFWCFAFLMDKIGHNFREDHTQIYQQLLKINKLLCVVDSELHEHLESISSLHMMFCYRWVLLYFRNEFGDDDIKLLWEVLWTDHMSNDFHLYIALAVLLLNRKMILEMSDFESLMCFIQSLSGKIKLEDTLNLSIDLYLSIERNAKSKPTSSSVAPTAPSASLSSTTNQTASASTTPSFFRSLLPTVTTGDSGPSFFKKS